MAWHDKWPHKVYASVLLLDGKIETWKTGNPPKKEPMEFSNYWKLDRMKDYTCEYVGFEVNNDQEHDDAFRKLAPEWFRQWELAVDFHGSPPYSMDEDVATPMSCPDPKVKFKHHFKLEFDVKTNSEDMFDLLTRITGVVKSNLESQSKLSGIEVLPTVTVIEDGEGEG